jgi:HK97 gp10 family phage protein
MNITIKGSKAIERAFRELPSKLARKAIRQGLRAGAKIVRDGAVADAPEDTGLTRKAIKVRSGRSRKNRFSMAVIIGKGNYKGATFYGAFQEFGWETGSRKSPNRREVPGKHFMRRAMESKRDAAESAILETIADGIEREAGRSTTAP